MLRARRFLMPSSNKAFFRGKWSESSILTFFLLHQITVAFFDKKSVKAGANADAFIVAVLKGEDKVFCESVIVPDRVNMFIAMLERL